MASTSATSTPGHPRPIILVTGANSGLGFATCQRLLLQLSSPMPSDTVPYAPKKRPEGVEPLATPFAAPHGCTVILACRNPIKAHKARRALVDLVDRLRRLPDHVGTPTSVEELQKWDVASPTGARETLLQQEPEELLAQGGVDVAVHEDNDPVQVLDRHEENADTNLRQRKAAKTETDEVSTTDSTTPLQPRLDEDVEKREARARGIFRRNFCRGTKVEFVALDLGSMGSVLTCAKQVQERYPYLTHLILNAGGAAFTGINWPLAVWMIMTQFKTALTAPRYKTQRSGDLSQDKLGWVWQINVGGSWALTQGLLNHLRQSPYSTPSRIIWTSSVEAMRAAYDAQDFQCLRTDVPSKAYESTKYQCDLASFALQDQLDSLREQEAPDAGQSKGWTQPDVFRTHPGVVATSIMADYLNFFTSTAMLCAFYIARWLMSTHHCVAPYKGSIAHTFTALAPTSVFSAQAQPKDGDGTGSERTEPESRLARYASQCDFFGREYVAAGRVDGWDEQDERYSVGPAAAPRASEEAGQVRTLAREWRSQADAVLKKVRRDSDAGKLPPATMALREEMGRVLGTGSSDDEEREWEKVDQTV